MPNSLWKMVNRHSWIGPLAAWVMLYGLFALMVPETLDAPILRR